MTTTPLYPVADLLTRNRAEIEQQWVSNIMTLWSGHYAGLVSEDELRQQGRRLLDQLNSAFADCPGATAPEIASDSVLAVTARDLSTRRAKSGFKPADTAQYVLSLKNVLTEHLVRKLSASSAELTVCLRAVDDVLDHLSLLTFEAYAETREKVIAQQSLSLMELSTPVIRLWEQVLMLPLIGVIDTLRARQFTESLLEAITRYEALVTIIDVTGVPVFDTSVAQHIMKTVDAAQLLGTRVIMTGISPEGAQTLTKLGISFAKVISRATLRAGVAEALQMIGKRVVAVSGAGR